jgi:hypothetical protein
MITTERNQNGSYTVTALVADGVTSGTYFKSRTYYGYTKTEAVREYREEFKSIIRKA